MNQDIHIEIVTPFGPKYSGHILSCVLPGAKGQFQILKNHAPVIAEIAIGSIKLEQDNKIKIYIATSGGFCEIKDNVIKVIVESAEKSESIDVRRALEAKERAEKRLQSKSEGLDESRAKLALARAINRLNVQKYSS